MATTHILERLDALKEEIQHENFLSGDGLSKEVNIQIFCYDAADEMAVRHFTSQLLVEQGLKCRIIHRNLYKMVLDICDEYRITDRIPAMEERKGGETLLRQMSGALSNEEFLAKTAYEDRTPGQDVLLITGVGDAFPFIRVHHFLEVLQSEFKGLPILVMYPGHFTSYELKLFNRLKPNPYYRGFNIIDENVRT